MIMMINKVKIIILIVRKAEIKLMKKMKKKMIKMKGKIQMIFIIFLTKMMEKKMKMIQMKLQMMNKVLE